MKQFDAICRNKLNNVQDILGQHKILVDYFDQSADSSNQFPVFL